MNPDKKTEKARTTKHIPEEIISETSHTVLINGEQIGYTATAGTIILKDENGAPKASIFFTAYTKSDIMDMSNRPLTFSFNGGPGSSSAWLHLGLLGPRRVLLEENGRPLPPPFKLINNEYSLLDVTDVVFIDPVSTGYSRVVPGEKSKQFHGVEKDIESVGEFIRLYVTRSKRWSSPKFLIGESYGTTRAAGLAGHLQDQHGMYLNGIMLLSLILNFQCVSFNPGNDLPYILFLPTYTATAWYHKQLSEGLQKDLRETLKDAEEFAQGEYATALIKGATLSEHERAQVIQKLARYTGLSLKYVEQTNLRINVFRFVKELLRDKRQTVGRLDSRFTGIDRDAAGESFEYDPSHTIVQGPFSAAINDYLRTELKFESDLPYRLLTGKVQPWNYGKYRNRYVDLTESLRKAMTKNPFLRIFVGSGYYDLATPYFASRYTLNHLGIDISLRKNVSMSYYESGHMMYTDRPSLLQLKGDLAHFIRSSIKN
ncbi:MAG: peptidase S10 [Thermodesulfobacteriota bacterium]|nr:peptidase S10 [Thermodesulfobacteriota bacterium]